YIASVGLRVLMLASRQARTQGGTVAIAALGPLVREIFEISKFTLVFPCFASVADALAGAAARSEPGGSAPWSRPLPPARQGRARADPLRGDTRLSSRTARDDRPPPEARPSRPKRGRTALRY